MMRFIMPLILLAISVGLFFTYTQKTYGDIQALQVKESSYNDALTNANELETVRDQLLEKYNMFAPGTLDRLAKLLPDNVDNIKLILEINDVAVRYGMSLKNVKFDSAASGSAAAKQIEQNNSKIAEKNKEYGIFDVEFSTEGTYPNFVAFIEDIEKSLRIVDVNSITFSSPENSGSFGGASPSKPADLYKYDFKISTYWLKN